MQQNKPSTKELLLLGRELATLNEKFSENLLRYDENIKNLCEHQNLVYERISDDPCGYLGYVCYDCEYTNRRPPIKDNNSVDTTPIKRLINDIEVYEQRLHKYLAQLKTIEIKFDT